MLSATFIDHLSDMFPSNNLARNNIRPLSYAFSHLQNIRVDQNLLHPQVPFDSDTDIAYPLHPRVGINFDWLGPDSGSWPTTTTHTPMQSTIATYRRLNFNK